MRKLVANLFLAVSAAALWLAYPESDKCLAMLGVMFLCIGMFMVFTEDEPHYLNRRGK